MERRELITEKHIARLIELAELSGYGDIQIGNFIRDSIEATKKVSECELDRQLVIFNELTRGVKFWHKEEKDTKTFTLAGRKFIYKDVKKIGGKDK